MIAIPYRDHVYAHASHTIMASIVTGVQWLMKQGVELEIGLCGIFRSHVHVARVELMNDAIKWGADVVVWFDDDAVPPHDLFQRLWPHLNAWDIVIPFFTTRGKNNRSVTMTLLDTTENGQRKLQKDRVIGPDDPPQAFGVSGFHCVVMKGEVLRKTSDLAGGNPFRPLLPDNRTLGEDICFYQCAYLAGFKSFIDTTVEVGHIGDHIYGKHELRATMFHPETCVDE